LPDEFVNINTMTTRIDARVLTYIEPNKIALMLHDYITAKKYDSVKELLGLGFKIKPGILNQYVYSGPIDTVEFLIENNAPEQLDSNDNTILHTAVRGNHWDIVEHLIETGYAKYINTPNKQGEIPLTHGLRTLNHLLDINIAKILYNAGSDLQFVTTDDKCALHYCPYLPVIMKQDNTIEKYQQQFTEVDARLNELRAIITTERKTIANLETTLNNIQMHVYDDEQ